jgi:hypothetical protein
VSLTVNRVQDLAGDTQTPGCEISINLIPTVENTAGSWSRIAGQPGNLIALWSACSGLSLKQAASK